MPDAACGCHVGIVADHQLTGTWIPLGVHYTPYTLCLSYGIFMGSMAANLNDAGLDIGPVNRLSVYIMASGVPVVIYYNGMISSAADYVLVVISRCRHCVCDGHHYHGSYHFIHYVLHNFLHLIVQHFVLNHTAKVGPFCTLRKRNTL